MTADWPYAEDGVVQGDVRDHLLVSCHYLDMAGRADSLAAGLAEAGGDTPESDGLYRLAGRLRSLAMVAGDVPLPDVYPVGAVRPWRCAGCVSIWDRLPGDRVRLLHYDETCPCFGRACLCERQPALFTAVSS